MSAHSSSSSSSSVSVGVSSLRVLLCERDLCGYIIPTSDAHQSEYVADCDKRRVFITGFTGSAGVALVLADSHQKSLLWTDGRYWLQASQQLSASPFELMKQGASDVPKLEEWLSKNLPRGSKVGIDPTLFSLSAHRALASAVKESGIEIVSIQENLVDKVWGAARPSIPQNAIFAHALEYSGESTASKLTRIRAKLAQQNCSALVVSALDEVAWLFNLRGSDISFNPVFVSYALVTKEIARLYVDEKKVTNDVKTFLGTDVEIRPYESFLPDLHQARAMAPFFQSHAAGLAANSANSSAAQGRFWVDPGKSSLAVYEAFHPAQVHEADSPIALMKALKNDSELNGMRAAHKRDAVAVINFLHWLEEALKKETNDVTSLTEVSVSDRLEAFRAEQKDFVGLSFETIAGCGPNGAIIHYKAEKETCKHLEKNSMFLLDSGAQFRDGTTDITRTIHLGTPNAFERRAFTRVLQGHIALAATTFPTGTAGPFIDSFARQFLWRDGLDYVHGTGHGVGAFLNVHEGPQGIGSTVRSAAVLNTALQPGMVVSNEPGYYEEGKFGVRIESLLIVVPRKTAYRFSNKEFLGFETITLVPIQHKLIDVTLLSDEEIHWLNAFHKDVREKIGPMVRGTVMDWLIENTKPISR